jgi:two-component system phosphate regulon response regulator PhoB
VDFLEFLRRRPEFRGTPVIMLSTEAAEITIDRALELGADTYVTKPVAIEELEQAMKKAFKAHGIN